MKLTDVLDRSVFETTLSGAPARLRSFVKDPLLKKRDEAEPAPRPVLESRQMVAGLLLLSLIAVLSKLVTTVATTGSIFELGAWLFPFLAASLMSPIWIAAGMAISFGFILALGFKGSFGEYAGVILSETVLLAVVSLILPVVAVFDFPYKVALVSILGSGLSLLVSYRVFRLCDIARPRILMVIGFFGLLSLVTALKLASFQSSMQAAQQAAVQQLIEQAQHQSYDY